MKLGEVTGRYVHGLITQSNKMFIMSVVQHVLTCCHINIFCLFHCK